MSHVLGGEVKRSGHREYGQALFSPLPGGALFRGLPRAQPRLDEPRRRRPARARAASRSWAAPRRTRSRPSRTRRAVSTACCSTPRSCTRRRAPRSSATSSTPAAAGATGTRGPSSRRRPSASASRSGPKGRVICALSGGVDSAVAALLVQRAIGERLTCVFVDNGLLRKDEQQQVKRRFAERLQPQGGDGRRVEALPGEARRRQRPRAQAQDHRPRVHRGVQDLDAQGRQGGLPGPGHAVSRT